MWEVANTADDRLIISIAEVLHDSSHELGVDPGLVKDGVEAHLQLLLADNPDTFGDGWTLVRREYHPTPPWAPWICSSGTPPARTSRWRLSGAGRSTVSNS